MSLSEVQSRTSEIAARLQALRGGTPLAGGTLGTAPTAFADALRGAQGALAPSAAAASVLGTGAGAQAVALAQQQVGTPYVFGGSQPGGFDCSGLVQWTYAQLGVALPRTSAEQGRTGTPVSPGDAQPGDLVYFDHAGPVDHIGIYAGNGTMVVAPHTGATVRLEKVDLSTATSIRRVTDTAAPTGAWAAALPAAAQPYVGAIAQAARKEGVDPALLSAVAWTESGFNASATSGAGAQGLMQLMPATAAGLGVDPLDPAQALAGGAHYLKVQLDRFGGQPDLALAAYNAGPTAVRKAGGIPPYPETQAYVDRVLTRYRQLGGAA
jgi:cell wall-associated NlpC family hydrolase